MLPAEPLITEHRLIERMISLMDRELQKIRTSGTADAAFIAKAADFLRTYADRCHHGKEEDILFRELAKKKLSPEHKKIMEELIREHVLGRGNVGKLIEANTSFRAGDKEALSGIISNLEILVKFYPVHIEKEDKRFFIPCMDYFSGKEKEAMLEEFREFDRKLIHDKYLKVVEELE